MKKLIPLLMSTLLLAACGGGSDDDNATAIAATGTTNSSNDCGQEGESGNYVEIECFTLSTTTISPSIDSGNFNAKWVTTTSQPVSPANLDSVVFSLSNGAASSVDSNSIEIYRQLSAPKTGQVSCNFGTDNVVKCGDSAAVEISSWLTTLPMDAYLIARTCTTSPPGTGIGVFGINTFDSCANESVVVKFQ